MGENGSTDKHRCGVLCAMMPPKILRVYCSGQDLSVSRMVLCLRVSTSSDATSYLMLTFSHWAMNGSVEAPPLNALRRPSTRSWSKNDLISFASSVSKSIARMCAAQNRQEWDRCRGMHLLTRSPSPGSSELGRYEDLNHRYWSKALGGMQKQGRVLRSTSRRKTLCCMTGLSRSRGRTHEGVE